MTSKATRDAAHQFQSHVSWKWPRPKERQTATSNSSSDSTTAANGAHSPPNKPVCSAGAPQATKPRAMPVVIEVKELQLYQALTSPNRAFAPILEATWSP